MSKEFSAISKDIDELKKTTKNIETKIFLMEKVLNELYELINNITIFIDEAEDIGDSNYDDEDDEDWTPYDDRNFSYDDDQEDIGGDDYWSSKQDES